MKLTNTWMGALLGAALTMGALTLPIAAQAADKEKLVV